MSLITVLNAIIHILYRLTVGLTVLLLQTGLLYLICLLTVTGWFALVVMVTWKTYTATDHHLGWTALALGLTVFLFGGLIVVLHRVAKEKLGLTKLSLSQLAIAMYTGRSQPAGRPQDVGGGGRHTTGQQEGAEQLGQVKTTQRKVATVTRYSSGSSVQTRMTAETVQT